MSYSEAFKDIETIETNNLILRKINAEDESNYDKVLNAVETFKHDTKFWIERNLRSFKKRDEITWGIAKKDNNKIIGQIILHNFIQRKQAEVSYGLNKDFWGQGITSEAVNAIVKYVFEVMELEKLNLKTLKVNDPSIKVAKKCGFTEEGLIRKGKFGDIFADYYIYGYLKEEYEG